MTSPKKNNVAMIFLRILKSWWLKCTYITYGTDSNILWPPGPGIPLCQCLVGLLFPVTPDRCMVALLYPVTPRPGWECCGVPGRPAVSEPCSPRRQCVWNRSDRRRRWWRWTSWRWKIWYDSSLTIRNQSCEAGAAPQRTAPKPWFQAIKVASWRRL